MPADRQHHVDRIGTGGVSVSPFANSSEPAGTGVPPMVNAVVAKSRSASSAASPGRGMVPAGVPSTV
jgi:hypothetical protein